MDNPETLATLGTQETGRRQTKQKHKHNTTQRTKKISGFWWDPHQKPVIDERKKTYV
jgi:hypothetical protein